MPDVTWSTKGHSGANVRLFAVGPGSEAIAGTLDNTDIAKLALGTFTGPTRYTPVVAAATPEAAAKGD
jgi:alkaline phosphatase